jgi:hypothetical protein
MNTRSLICRALANWYRAERWYPPHETLAEASTRLPYRRASPIVSTNDDKRSATSWHSLLCLRPKSSKREHPPSSIAVVDNALRSVHGRHVRPLYQTTPAAQSLANSCRLSQVTSRPTSDHSSLSTCMGIGLNTTQMADRKATAM